MDQGALDRYAEYVGEENVITDEAELKKYTKDQSFVDPTMPELALKPQNTEMVKKVMDFSNRNEIPVVPYSCGEDNQGCAIPEDGCVMLDVSEMDEIINIDTDSRVAIVEPGVTFDQLQDAAKEEGLRALPPVELPSSASVLTTYLEYFPQYYWARFSEHNLLTMDIILPDGRTMKTGQGACPAIDKSYCKDFSVPSAGMMSNIWFGAQGTLGVATKGVVKLKNDYDNNKMFFIPLQDMEKGFEAIREIAWLRAHKEMFMCDDTELSLLLGGESDDDFEATMESLPPWTLVVVLRGEEDRVEFQELDVKDKAEELGLEVKEELSGVDNASERLFEELEYPDGWKGFSNYRGARNTLPFMTPVKKMKELQGIMDSVVEEFDYNHKNVGTLILPTSPGRAHGKFSLHRDPDDAEQTETAEKLYLKAAKRLITAGAFFSRPYGPLSEMVYERSENYHKVIREMKEKIDPNNIMNPGKLYI